MGGGSEGKAWLKGDEKGVSGVLAIAGDCGGTLKGRLAASLSADITTTQRMGISWDTKHHKRNMRRN